MQSSVSLRWAKTREALASPSVRTGSQLLASQTPPLHVCNMQRACVMLASRTSIMRRRVRRTAGRIRGFAIRLGRLFERPDLDDAVGDRARGLRGDLHGLIEAVSLDQREPGYRERGL